MNKFPLLWNNSRPNRICPCRPPHFLIWSNIIYIPVFTIAYKQKWSWAYLLSALQLTYNTETDYKESRILLEPHSFRCETVDTSVESWRHIISVLRNYLINVFQNQSWGWLSECEATVRRHRMKMILWVEWLQSEIYRTASMSLILYIFRYLHINVLYPHIST